MLSNIMQTILFFLLEGNVQQASLHWSRAAVKKNTRKLDMLHMGYSHVYPFPYLSLGNVNCQDIERLCVSLCATHHSGASYQEASCHLF